MPSPILARADALMQRRRQNAGEADDIPVLTDTVEAVESEDDVPVLLDIERPTAPAEPAPPHQAAPEPPQLAESSIEKPGEPAFDAALRDILAYELARRVEQRLAAELPRIIEATVRDFLAEQENIAALQSRD